VLGGVVFVGYRIYVADQDSGIYYFPVFIFVLPFGLAGKIIYDMIQKKEVTDDNPRRSQLMAP
jgi:hypothetical protein